MIDCLGANFSSLLSDGHLSSTTCDDLSPSGRGMTKIIRESREGESYSTLNNFP